MIVLRIAGGISQHFGIRVPEWLMALPLLGWGALLTVDPSTFATSNSFNVLAEYGTEAFWANVCFVVAFMRLLALAVNGTFQQFSYSPMIRSAASVAAAIFWGQITLGVSTAWLFYGGAATGIAAYGTFTVFELWNVFRARADMVAQKRFH